jgi:hypothetical protein
VPVDAEPLSAPAVYGYDRVFVHLQLGKKIDIAMERKLSALEKTGQPVIRLQLRDVFDIGAEFFRWEFAVATAGALIGIDAFDQPNVQESKDNTKRVLADKPAEEKPLWANKQYAVYATIDLGAVKNLRDALRSFTLQVRKGDYLAIMAYLEQTPANNAALKAMRVVARDHLKIATTVGYGPRFLHSTGQLHKGGASTVLGLQITADDTVDVAIPGEPYSFGTLKRAQAIGDWQALQSHDRRALRVHLKRGVKPSALAAEMKVALGLKSTARKSKPVKKKSVQRKK